MDNNIITSAATVALTDIIQPICGEYAEDLLDWDGNNYICDAISEIADDHTSIYYSDILDFIRREPEALADVVAEGLYTVDSHTPYNLYKHAQAAEYMTIERDICEHLEDAIKAYAAHYIRTTYHMETVPADIWDAITAALDDIDNNNTFDDIAEIVDKHITPKEEEYNK